MNFLHGISGGKDNFWKGIKTRTRKLCSRNFKEFSLIKIEKACWSASGITPGSLPERPEGYKLRPRTSM